MYHLENRSRFLRQTIACSNYAFPELNHLFNSRMCNVFGRFKMKQIIHGNALASLYNVTIKVPQVFHRFECDTLVNVDEERFKVFKEKVHISLKIDARFYPK